MGKKLSRRCSKQGCRNWYPCSVHPDGWARNQSRPLPSNWGQIKRQDAWKKVGGCAHCGARQGLELDHIEPRFAGGSDTPENRQWLCHPCHLKKSRDDKIKYRPKK